VRAQSLVAKNMKQIGLAAPLFQSHGFGNRKYVEQAAVAAEGILFPAGRLLVVVQCNFGVEEILDPGLCVECEAGQFHVNEDHFLVKVVEGELVVTTLCREAMPLLRYRTRVACTTGLDKCPCGRTGAILQPGERLDRRLRVNETPLYEGQIAQLLAQTRVAWHKFWVDVSERRVVISIQLTEDLFSDMIWPLMELERELELEFLARLGVPAEVRFVQRQP